MEWTASFLSPEKILLIETKGTGDEGGSLEMAKSIKKEMIKYKTNKCLIDHSQLISVTGKTVDIYYRPKSFFGIKIPIRVKIAEVVRPEHKEFFRFLETVLLNRGFRFQIFHDRDSAIAWLRE